MKLSISELLGRGSDIVKLPSNNRDEVTFKSNEEGKYEPETVKDNLDEPTYTELTGGYRSMPVNDRSDITGSDGDEPTYTELTSGYRSRPVNNRDEIAFKYNESGEAESYTIKDNPDDPQGSSKIISRPTNDRTDTARVVDALGKTSTFDERLESELNKPYVKDELNYTGDRVVQDSLKIISDTLGKYKQWKDDPVAYISLFGGNLKTAKTSGKVAKGFQHADKILENFGIDLLDAALDSSVVPIPPYMSKEDGAILTTAVNAVKKGLSQLFNGKPTTNYDLIRTFTTNSGVLNDIINFATGNYLKKEFEKNRYSFRLPDSRLSEGFPVGFYDGMSGGTNSTSPSIGDRIVDSIKSKVNDYIKKGYQGIDAGEIIYGNKGIDSTDVRLKGDYFTYTDPYESTEFISGKNGESPTLSDIFTFMEGKNLLTGYKDFAGFEVGSDHMWKIEIHPYQSKKHKEKTCVPPLPFYALPNVFGTTNQIISGIPEYGNEDKTFNWASWINTTKDKIFNDVVERLVAINDYTLNDPDNSIKDAITQAVFKKYNKGIGNEEVDKKDVRWFSFAEDPPVISYSLSLGQTKNESMPLFNGGSMEFISGMNYVPILTVTMLDDSHRSMFKYMTTYINSIYDIETSSLAPYYSMAFEIRLTIMRSGGRINQKFKFIGIPGYYSPTLNGDNDPADTRIDIQFNIIGMILDGFNKDSEIDGYVKNSDPKLGNENESYSLTWNDIQLKMG